MKPLQSIISTCAVLLLVNSVSTASAASPLFGSATPSPSLLGTPVPTSPEVTALSAEGQAAFQRGDIQKAKEAFDMAYSLDTRNTVVVGYLRRIKEAEKTMPRSVDREKQYAAVIIPKLEFRDATLGSALDFVKRTVDKQTGGKQPISIVVQMPTEQINTLTVTLNLTNIPVTEALRYIADLVNANVIYEKYAVVIRPRAGAPTVSATTTVPATAPVPAQ
jgi:hypothetical protein